ncbi:DUF2634 domain-containing protein [uncultured Tissierella sp.]|jgi:hypothetical protein|uniref:DUF2634 domain-containing protein n=1 Tax=uncultured Tissierella sp. TaxID=448160 RepID=UPI0028050512|nr:DUF2634 domain-containing protein [uncultured Tissierella sp.]MDU5082812.1 DUF2634 domain-containing protein [Bacillota bacterium]
MIFPKITELELPKQDSNVIKDLGKTFLYDFQKREFILKDGKPIEVVGKKGIEIWIEKVLRTQKNRWKIYDEVDYGTTIEDLIVGHSYPKSFLESELKREITQEVLKHPRIESLTNWDFIRVNDKLRVIFTVNLYDGDFIKQEVSF